MTTNSSYITQDNESLVSFVDQLSNADISLTRFLEAKTGTKKPAGEWIAHHPDNVGQNSLIKSGNGLLIVDIDDWEATPQWVKELIKSNPTLTVQSPHATGKEGHYYFSIDEAPFSKNEHSPEWGEIKYGALTVTPGSEVHGLRNGKDCSEGCCTPENPGRYKLRQSRPLGYITADELPINTQQSHTTVTWDTGLPDSDEFDELDLPEEYDGETVRNEFGMSVSQLRTVSTTVDRLCQDITPGIQYNSPSEADFKFSQLLYFWGFERQDCKELLKYYRSRRKVKQRPDYVHMTVKNAAKNTIDRMDPELGFALLKSSDDVGPAGTFNSLTVMMGAITHFAEHPGETKQIVENCHYDYRKALRNLHILADAGRIERNGNNPIEWQLKPDHTDIPLPPYYSL